MSFRRLVLAIEKEPQIAQITQMDLNGRGEETGRVAEGSVVSHVI
jgi:hypothetical protein